MLSNKMSRLVAAALVKCCYPGEALDRSRSVWSWKKRCEWAGVIFAEQVARSDLCRHA